MSDGDLAEFIGEFYADPLGYVMASFPWDSDSSIQLVELKGKYRERFDCIYGPDEWACEFLDQLGEEIKKRKFDGVNAVDPIKWATVSGHGIGKSALVAWLVKFISDTRPYSKGTITANTADQLKSKTWAEVGKWHRRSLTYHWFDYNSSRGNMSLVHKRFPHEWFCTAQTCREENSEAFAGQHAPNSTSYYIFDEASAIPEKIFQVREGGTTDGEPMIFDFGNPTRNSGMFFENAVGRFSHRYRLRTIDSRNVAITNKERIQQWVDDYGEDSDFVKVRVRGLFPSASSLQFIPVDLVEAAMERTLVPASKTDALVLGVDVARFGDDNSVIYPRFGYDARSFAPEKFSGLDTMQLVGRVVAKVDEFRGLGVAVSAIFVDGTGIGAGVVDTLSSLGYNVIEVQFGSKPSDFQKYRYRSDEIWGLMKDALPRLMLPSRNTQMGVELKSDLTQREFGYTAGEQRIHLESKRDMKARGIPSPDLADALALTFAVPVAPIVSSEIAGQKKMATSEYDPLETTW